jgi:hypothetical protein
MFGCLRVLLVVVRSDVLGSGGRGFGAEIEGSIVHAGTGEKALREQPRCRVS